MTDLSTWRAARRAFDEALELPQSERGAFVARQREIDAEIGRALATLLLADESSCELLDSDPAHRVATYFSESEEQSWIGRTIGPYRLIDRLGTGGMGFVFLGERTDDVFDKQVAIKLLSVRWLDTGGAQRFERERRILARLEHPGIARILDGGATESGLPYLVMEYVDGRPITDFCDQEELTLESRLRLFRKVCSAVEYAHRNLVVHRDLKADNILVTADGEPKLLDFGISGLVASRGEDLEADSREAATGVAIALTPSYASPEQILGQETATGSDVYSLGVLLYRLLTGNLPARRASRSLAELRAELATERIAPPSALLGATGSAGGISSHRFKGDLDAIAMKSLAPAQSDRYATVGGLMADVEHYLGVLPVEARGGGAIYRLGKLIRRHPWTVGATSAAVTALLSFTGFTVAQARRLERETRAAEHQRSVSEGVSQFLVDAFEWADPHRSGGGDVTATEILEYSTERVASGFRDDPALRGALLAQLGRVHRSLGSYDKGAELLDEAVALQSRHLLPHDPALLETRLEYARTELARGDSEAARRLATTTQAVAAGTQEAVQGSILHVLGRIARAEGRLGVALDLHRQGLTYQEGHEPTDAYVDGLMAYSRALQDAEQRAAAEAPLRDALVHQQRLHPGNHPLTARALRDLSILTYRNGNYEKALPIAEEGLAMHEALFGPEHPSTGQMLNTLGNVYRNSERLDSAEESFRRSIRIKRLNLGDDHPTVAVARYNLATFLHRERAVLVEAEPLYRAAIQSAETAGAAAHHRLDFFRVGLGDLLVERGRAEEGLVLIESALASFSTKAGDKYSESWNVALARNSKGAALLSMGRAEDAEAHLTQSQPVLEKRFGVEHRISRRAQGRLELLRH